MDADVTVSFDREDLNQVIMGNAKLAELPQSGLDSVNGDAEVLPRLTSVSVNFARELEILSGATN